MGMRRRPLGAQPSSAESPSQRITPARRARRHAAAEDQQNQQIADLQAPAAVRAAAAAVRRRRLRQPPRPAATDMVTQLENLKKLLDEGVLTQAEFDMQKQKLLSAS